MDHEQVHDIRESLCQELERGRDEFKGRIEQMTRRQTQSGNGRPRVEEMQGIYQIV